MPPLASPPRILFRADARPDLGGGHIMRCLSLALVLKQGGAEIAFACAPGSDTLVPALQRSGFPVLAARSDANFDLPAAWRGQADALVIDLYSSTRQDETQLRSRAGVIAVIEDLPDRTHDCDILIDQGFDRNAETYAPRLPPGTQCLIGPNLVPLRPGFAAQRDAALARRAKEPGLARLLIAMGLTDLGGISARLVTIVRACLPDLAIDVVVGPTAPSLPVLQSLAQTDPQLTVMVDTDDMASCMARADFAIGAGGGTALERCVLGLPSLVIVLAENQRPAALALAKRGAAISLDSPAALETELPPILARLSSSDLRPMSAAAAAVCDGLGAQRIADALLARIGASAN